MLKWVDSKPYTRNLVPNDSTYWEVQRKIGGVEFRYWNPEKSKLAAFLVKKGKTFPLEPNSTILYLGAASGTTVSHISDICQNGRIFAVEVAKNPFRELLNLAEKRPNIVPILEDANQPDIYSRLVGQVDIMYQDIAQRNQTDIFIKNSFMLIMRRARMEGFLILDFLDRFEEAQAEMFGWVLEGKVTHKVHLVNGLENSVEALNLLFTGGNTGKVIVEI